MGAQMLEQDFMTHLDLIEAAACKVGLKTKRESFRSLEVVQIQEVNGEWCTFDPIRNGKDLAKFLWHGAKLLGLHHNEQQFREDLLRKMMTHDYSVQEKR